MPTTNRPAAPLVLAILDGVGLAPPTEDNSVWLAHAPFLHSVLRDETVEGHPAVRTELRAHGTAVGLPSDADMGNSEVGHNILGAGRIFDQGAKQVEQAMADGRIWGDAWRQVMARGAAGKRVHFIGLLSDGNVHSHIRHLEIMLERAATDGATHLVVHVLLDGRDVRDGTGDQYVQQLEAFCADLGARTGVTPVIGSGGGRMGVTMDRYEADWSVVQRGYQAHCLGSARPFRSATEAITTFRTEDPSVSDQFLPPFTVVDAAGTPVGAMQAGDAVVLFNFRGDRMIEVYRALTETPFDAFDRGPLPADLLVTGLALYDGDLKIPAEYLVPPTRVTNTVSEVIATAGLHQAAIAETQKYGHVTYFWNGNRSDKFDDGLEDYVEIESDRVPFEQRPWMKSAETADEIIRCIREGRHDFIRANFAAGDMVGHTGSVQSATIAVEGLDISLRRVFEEVRRAGGTLIVTADHGNCEIMVERDSKGAVQYQADGTPVPKKSHTLSPVPFVMLDFLGRTVRVTGVERAGLANVAATLLQCLGLPAPADYAPAALTVQV
ncbi:MAG TPA: 2,3-bisphosphoglycerate-independent phosphoglycerate mutase [Ilumatobacteraceae bacterium]|nr:2,3-bisphosphoglycerate-independent phosphoglycerate mutase [Ilumatobacteraceae bacterium]